jgi:hypothetical protein
MIVCHWTPVVYGSLKRGERSRLATENDSPASVGAHTDRRPGADVQCPRASDTFAAHAPSSVHADHAQCCGRIAPSSHALPQARTAFLCAHRPLACVVASPFSLVSNTDIEADCCWRCRIATLPLKSFLLIPIGMRRPAGTRETLGRSPVVEARRAHSFGIERRHAQATVLGARDTRAMADRLATIRIGVREVLVL